MAKCTYCKEEIIGRAGKKFCTPYCKSAYHYQKAKSETPSFYFLVDKQLKTNRRILKKYNKAGKSYLRVEKMHEEGFNPNIFTHYWKNTRGEVYLFCYEFGFLKTEDNNSEKYLLIKWQDYMSKKIGM